MSSKKFKNQAIEMLVFVCLILTGFKLSGSIIAVDWSWWLVFSPLSILLLNYIIIGCLILFKLSSLIGKTNANDNKRVYIE